MADQLAAPPGDEATMTAAIVANAMTRTTALSGAGWPSRMRRAWLRIANKPPPKIVVAAK